MQKILLGHSKINIPESNGKVGVCFAREQRNLSGHSKEKKVSFANEVCQTFARKNYLSGCSSRFIGDVW